METFRKSFDRTFGAGDSKQNIPFPVQVPEGTTHLHIRFTYAPLNVDDISNLLTLTVFDPSGWRGAGHRHSGLHEVVIAADGASAGYLPGPVQPGEWTVVIDTHMVMPGPPCLVHLEVSGTDESAAALPPLKPGHTASRGPGWYRGDVHAHTFHSDARWDVDGLTAFARSQRLDFTALTDHNTVSGLAAMDAACADDLLTMGGMELTTFWGHALVLGLRHWVDWRVREGERSMEQIEAEVTATGGLFVIAHPKSIGDPFCTGCDWRYPAMMPGSAHVVEFFHTEWTDGESNNEDSLRLVYGWLNQGRRLALTAGTDNHGDRPERFKYAYNVVYAEDLSEPAILEAIRAGHLYLSSGPELKLEAVSGSQKAMMGDVLPASDGKLSLSTQWSGCPESARIDYVIDGKIEESLCPVESASHSMQVDGARAHWCLATMRDSDGVMLAVTNPIYLDGRR
jgi:hypothetical protein